MTTTVDSTVPLQRAGWFARSEAWLDDKGKGAWIAAMVLGFIFFWPVGLALLAYMIWSKRMFAGSCSGKSRRHYRHHRRHGHSHGAMHMSASTGNSAFDAYKAETLQRLMDEQQQFESFLDRLRDAKDKREFDQFMDERATAVQAADDTHEEAAESEDDTIVTPEPKSK